jgi:pantoate--beta-alanine ligase
MAPQVWKTVSESQSRCASLGRSGATIGVIPTMGALHEGHLSLVQASQDNNDATVVTIFVNPTQFGANEDLSCYPRTFDEDLKKLGNMGVDAVFAPSVEEMYPAAINAGQTRATTSIDPPAIALPLEGACRPGHFRGVATIVLKLFLAVPADRAYFGQKDYQQFLVVQQMAKELKHPIEIHGMPIVREPDGLAMSSRNRYLSDVDRQRALALHRTLLDAKKWMKEGEVCGDIISNRMRDSLAASVDKIDYALVADAATLEPLTALTTPHHAHHAQSAPRSVAALVAAYVGSTRLIDNEVFELPSSP